MNARRRLRVAYVVSQLDPGGAEGQMLALAERLPGDTFAVDFICTSEPGTRAERAREAGARVVSLGSPPDPGSGPIAAAVHRVRKIARLVAVLRRNRYDIVDAWMYPAYDLAALSRPLTRVGVVLAGRRNLHGPEVRYGALERAVDGVARRLCDLTVANSRLAADYAIQHEGLAPKRIRVIHNGVELPEVGSESASAREALRRGWGISPLEVVIGCVANLRPVKDHAALLRAVAGVASRIPALRLVLVGEGPERRALEAQVAGLDLGGRVVLHGREADARRLYPAFDIAALTSRSEGLPNTLLEAAAAALPAVATAVGGVPEVVVDGVTGLLVASGDSGALEAAITRLATDPALRRRMGDAARERVEREFGMDRFVAEVAALYRELTGGGDAAP